MTPQEMIDVIAAYRDGKQIQAQPAGICGDEVPWKTCRCPDFNFPEYNYRIKPAALRPHWPAIVRSPFNYFTTTATLFADEASCRENVIGFVRLATEYPPVMLP